MSLLLWVKLLFLPKNADISQINRAFVLKGIFSETTHVLMYQIRVKQTLSPLKSKPK